MRPKNDFLDMLEYLRIIYDKLDEDNKTKLEEALQMVLTKFKNRV